MRAQELKKLADQLPGQDRLMPVLFIGHGSPMNAIEDNIFTDTWHQLGQEIPKPQAILVVSAHWLTRGTHVTAMTAPPTIHDFGGFPQELFEVSYPAPGDPALAREIQQKLHPLTVGLDHEWGLDHSTWSITRQMFPNADIPVLQLSIDYHRDAQHHYELGQALSELRKKGVLIIGSGNLVHNLRMIDFRKAMEKGPDGQQVEFGYDWAIEINETFKRHIHSGNHQALVDFQKLGKEANLAIPTPDHYFPLLYTLGLVGKQDDIQIFNDAYVGGSISMTSVRIG
ncbi:4,5-DOPA dioxygenase extradiol [Pontibacter sp. G13]|uniref:4,5-DOPA-extradiol-dioxygenase n=1 Tax=Pontibacter sp. G13 TaxID=3074898 RepID=UPI0028890AA9|nr:4,5-DOPA dioxygenase extradiol [Pontibacter sp. G13]WNJ18788.1 4,5-DOPA dioxygenase extradiol [Pontibacter sp. G13]